MQKLLPLFPLGLVVYPKEKLNLHIFEPRYRELVNDCQLTQGTFGIPTYLNERIPGYGTEVEIVGIDTIYEDGRMDIKTRGVQVFRIIDFQNPMQGHGYAGGTVESIALDTEDDPVVRLQLIEKTHELFNLLQMQINLDREEQSILSYEIAHKIGLSLEQQYTLLTLSGEKERQEFMLEHLLSAIPVVEEMERTKHLIRMNGHFKHFDPLNF